MQYFLLTYINTVGYLQNSSQANIEIAIISCFEARAVNLI